MFSNFSFQRRSNSLATRRFLASTASYCSKAFLASYSNCSSLLLRAMRCAASPALSSSSALRLAFTPRGEITRSSSWPNRRSTDAPPKANTVLPTVVKISLAEITRIGAAASPVTYMELAATMPTAKKTHQKTLSGANRGHGFIPLPVYGITPQHSLILFIGCPVNIAHVMIRDEDPALFRLTRSLLMLLQPAVDQQRRNRTAAPHIGASIEGVDQDIAHQALGRNLPDQLCPLDRVRGQLYVVIPEPQEGLTHAPPLSKLHEHKSNGFANSLIGMPGDLAHWIENIADRKPFEQLATARFGLLSRLHSLPNHLQFNNTQSPFYS